MRWKGLRFVVVVVVVVSLVYILHTRILYYIRIIRVYTYCVTYCQSNGENNHFDHSSFGTLSALYTHTRVFERWRLSRPRSPSSGGAKKRFFPEKRVPVWVQVLCVGCKGGGVFSEAIKRRARVFGFGATDLHARILTHLRR